MFKSIPLKIIFLFLSILLIIPISFMFVKNALYDYTHAREMALGQAMSIVNKDKSLRAWAASHGGVYVPADPKRTPPNPYLSHIPDRDLYVNDLNLTLMNPAYVIRQMMSEYKGIHGSNSKITSLKPINKINAPDIWEAKALKKIEKEKTKEYYEFVDKNGSETLRLMSVLITEADCLKCHWQQGYEVGDVRGGISVTVPMEYYNAIADTLVMKKVVAFSVAISTILLILLFAYKRVKKDKEIALEQQKVIMEQSRHAAMGEMIGAIAHQMKQPLNVISITTQGIMMDSEDDSLDKKSVEEYGGSILTQIKYMSDTIDDFRNFFNPDKKKCDFSLGDVTNKSIKILEKQLKSHGITVEVTGEELSVHGSFNELEQVIINLVNNGKDALIENNVKNGKISIFYTKEDEKCVIKVADNGGGISDENMDKIFRSYFTTKGKKGTGIGLYMSRMIVEDSFGGTLSVQNNNGGAEFTIKLPLI